MEFYELWLFQSFHASFYAKKITGIRLLLPLFLAQSRPGRGNIQFIQVLSAKRATGGICYRQVDLALDFPRGIIACDLPTTPPSTPDAALAVNVQAICTTSFIRGRDKRSA